MNDDINIYDGKQIEGSSEAKSRNTWVEMFDMIGMFFLIHLNLPSFKKFVIPIFGVHLFARIYIMKMRERNT